MVSTEAAEELTMQPLHPNVVRAWRISRLIWAPIVGAIVGVQEWVLGDELREHILMPPRLTITFIVVALLVVLAIVLPKVQYNRWRYAIRADDVLITYGIVWRVRRCIPRLRIQHVDITSGPFQRMLGLVSLNLYTAGVMGAVGQIPGITAPQAERIREQLIGTTVDHG
jgi:uncharacterized protein